MATVSNFEKFRLLLWKNWLIQWNHKCQMLIEILLPGLFAYLVLFVRSIRKPVNKPTIIYEEVDIKNVNLFEWITGNFKLFTQSINEPLFSKLLYSPNTSSILDEIMNEATNVLGFEPSSGFANAADLENVLRTKNYFAGVQFDESITYNNNRYPKKLSFCLRFPYQLRTTPEHMGLTWNTYRLWNTDETPGPRNPVNSDGGYIGYLREGFLPVQNAITRAYLRQASKTDNLPDVVMQRYPHPAYISDQLLSNFELFVTFILVLGFIYSCMNITKNITAEKENQLKEFMKIMGLQNWIHWTAWFIKNFVMMAMSSILITCIFKISSVPVVGHTDWSVLLFFFLVYSIMSICFCFMLAVFFSKANTAAGCVGLVLFLSYIPFDILNYSFDDLSIINKYLCCLLLNNALGFGLKMIFRYESIGDKLHWNNIFKTLSVDNDISIGGIMVAMLVSCIVYMSICLYIEQIYPGDFGVPKKWNYPITTIWNHYRTNTKTISVEKQEEEIGLNNETIPFESVPHDKPAKLMIKNLRKVYNQKVAVNNVSLNFYENEITVLLGHNGAGKTTIISIITGMICPTSGTVLINESDIRTDTNKARASLGYCPQQNILFNDLTVSNHIVLFSRIKGIKGDDIRKEVDKYLKMTKLEGKADVSSWKLSGGMKRKLSLCAALCGATQVVICDEPSSGIDPRARRQIWTLLQNEKFGRTILLTTHLMDEAEILGDRIAILSNGVLKCYGTPFYLKRNYGSGYRLTCIKSDNCDSSMVTRFLQNFIAEIQVETEIGSELSFRLPIASSSIFPSMLKALESSAAQLNLIGFGIDSASIEDVLFKVNKSELDEDLMIESYGGSTEQNDDGDSMNAFHHSKNRLKGCKLHLNQWNAMIKKKFLNNLRNKLLFGVQNLIAIVFIVTAITIYQSNNFKNALPQMKISLSEYTAAVLILEKDINLEPNSFEAKVCNEYEKFVISHGSKYEIRVLENGKTLSDYVLNLKKANPFRFKKRYIAAATIRKDHFIAWLNNQPLHTAPLTVNLVYNAMARVLLGPSYQIEVTNAPYARNTLSSHIENLDQQRFGNQLAVYVCYAMSYVIAFYTMFLIKERETRVKLLQFVSGIGVWTFWLSHFIWDYFTYIITAIITTLTIGYFQEDGFSTYFELLLLFVVLLIFGVAALLMAYIFSMFSSEPASGFGRFAVCSFFFGVAMQVTVTILSSKLLDEKELADRLSWFFRLFPHFSLAQSISNLNANSLRIKLCKSIRRRFDMSHDFLCEITSQCCGETPYFSWNEPGIGREISCFIISAILFASIIIIKEFRVIGNIAHRMRRKLRKPSPDSQQEENVAKERDFVQQMNSDDLQVQNLVLDRVTKYYGKFLAVNQVSVCVRQSECFGLLGVNGAGKTTTFKMMTGDERISYGDAYVTGMNLNSQMSSIYKVIGYCPQFDALLDDLTGRETLKIFCLLRGIPKSQIQQTSVVLAKLFGFVKYLDKQTRTYSGGNKRKLSTAIAIIGSPSVIYLDEPTTGMDPAARRQLWNMVCRIRDAGKSIVLTSHSMEECEALCTRLAIMVNGEFKCLGSTQYLKNKFSKGSTLKIKLKKSDAKIRKSDSRTQDESDADEFNTAEVEEFVETAFPNCKLQDKFQGILTFRISASDIKWSQIFQIMENEKQKLNVEDYSVNQTTLEEIFLEFAKNQRESMTLKK